jgi:peroxiredoxin
MSRRLGYLAIVVVAGVAAVAGYLTRQGTPPTHAPVEARAAAGAEPLLAMTLPDLAGHAQNVGQWRGKVMVVNFWATWCPPCLTEIPDFAAVSERHADAPVQFVGIGIDSAANIAAFQQEHRVPYPLLVGSSETLKVATDLVGTAEALPLTIIVDRDGMIHRVKLGTLNQDELEGTIRALLAP